MANGIQLHFAPGSCSRVSLTALIATGTAFEPVLMRFMAGAHKSPGYRRLNPKGKVPLLVVDGAPLTENVAILSYLNQRFPEAALLPLARTPLDRARQIADLCFCSATLHPLVTRIRMPGMIAGPEAAAAVRDKASAVLREQLQIAEDRLAGGAWWYGDSWSVIDAYLGWVFFRIGGAGFAVADLPHLADHLRRHSARPESQQAIGIEAAAQATLEAEGLAFTPARPDSASPHAPAN